MSERVPGPSDEPGSSTTGGRPRLVVLSGPSGVGKSSVLAEVRRRRLPIHLSVSVTTRSPRPGEVDGEHYRFVDAAEFERMVAAGEFLEHAQYVGNRYGTPRGPVAAALASGTPSLLEIDVQGAAQVRAAAPDALLVMLVPPSWDALVARLTGRGTEDAAVMRRRLDLARRELDTRNAFDVTIVNDDVTTAADSLLTLLFDGGRDAPSSPYAGARE